MFSLHEGDRQARFPRRESELTAERAEFPNRLGGRPLVCAFCQATDDNNVCPSLLQTEDSSVDMVRRGARQKKREGNETEASESTAGLETDQEIGTPVKLRRSLRTSQNGATPSQNIASPVKKPRKGRVKRENSSSSRSSRRSTSEGPPILEAMEVADDGPTLAGVPPAEERFSRRKKMPKLEPEEELEELASEMAASQSLFTIEIKNEYIEAGEGNDGLQAQRFADAMLLLPDDAVAFKRCGRKTKLIPQERLLLSQLYHDNFAIYHSERYASTSNYYVYPGGNLKIQLQNNWVERLNSLGVGSFHRTTTDIEEFITAIISEVEEYRRLLEKAQKPPSNPAFLLINKIYDYIDEVHPRIEEILDKYELKLMLDREVEILVEEPMGAVWRDKETNLLRDLYKDSAAEYNVNVLRKEGSMCRENLLHLWSIEISALGTYRSPKAVERKICAYRREYREFKEMEAKTTWSKRPKKSLPAIAIDLSLGCVDKIDEEMTFDRVLWEAQPIHDEILKGEVPGRKKSPSAFGETSIPPGHNSLYEFSTMTCRTNRPHMSRRERHLLAMLYRKHNKDYDKHNTPHLSRKTTTNKKWALLQKWSDVLTSLGVSFREPEELATKISQYKNIVKNHKQAEREGVNSLPMKSGYRFRRCQRPMSPTTKLFDLENEEIAEQATDEKIEEYVTECHTMLNYPYGNTLPFIRKATSPTKTSPIKIPNRIVQVKPLTKGGKAEVTVKVEEPDISPPKPSICRQSTSNDFLGSIISNSPKTQTEEESNKIFESVYADCRAMESVSLPILAYDVVDPTGIVTQMVMTRKENHRDVNFYLWTKYMDVEVDQQLNFYVCYMCEQMSIGSGTERIRGQFPSTSLPGSGILAQQALPTIAVTADSKEVHISWMKTPPKHRCVPFLMATICEKLAGLSHMLKRTTDIPASSSH